MSKARTYLPFLLLTILMLLVLTVTARAEFQSLGVQTFSVTVSVTPTEAQNNIILEGTHLLNCQVKDAAIYGPRALGSINDVPFTDGPTWVVPRENGTAIIGLAEAYMTTGDDRFKAGALLGADYLKNRQEADGAWCRQYDEKLGTITDKNKTPSEAGSAIAAFFKIHQMGWDDSSHQYYENARKAAAYIMWCIDNKPGTANGLAGAGKEYGYAGNNDILGDYRWGSWSWVSDNCYAYLGLMYVKSWAASRGETDFANTCGRYAVGVLNGINVCLKNPNNAVWYRVVDGNGNQVAESAKIDALCYYPQKYDLPVPQYGTANVAQWMTDNLQEKNGSVSSGCGAFKWGDAGSAQESDRRSPGFSFEAWLALNDIPGSTAQQARDLAKNWWEAADNTGGRGALRDSSAGGYIDWYDPDGSPWGYVAPSWQRFIDTSANNILVNRGGFDYAMGISLMGIPQAQITHKALERISPQATVVVATGTVSDSAGVETVFAYYYTNIDTSVSTVTVAASGAPTAYNFRISMPVSVTGTEYFYYRLKSIDRSGYAAYWPAADETFQKVRVDPTYTATIGTGGGSISLPNENPDGGQTSLLFPTGALSEGTSITITEVDPSNTSLLPQSAFAISNGATPVAVYSFGPRWACFQCSGGHEPRVRRPES
jgi:hypothetical protein